MGEKAQSVSCQLCKHKDLILDSQHPLKANKQTTTKAKQNGKKETKNRTGVGVWIHNPNPEGTEMDRSLEFTDLPA